MERKLASIQKIDSILPIEGADNIELAKIKGWQVVVQKGLYKEGDFVLYCEIDSFLPIKPEYEFLRKSSYKKMGEEEGFRIRTMKLKGQISQGLILPHPDIETHVGEDISELLGIRKYEPPVPVCLSGKVKGTFPSFIPKTDEERIQNLKDVYEDFKKHSYYVTEKIYGSSATFYINNDSFGVCSRNLDLLETEDNAFWKIARSLDIENKMRAIGGNFAIQGELHGEGIQKNKYKLKGLHLALFNAFDIDNQKYFNMPDFYYLCRALNIDYVPILNNEGILPDNIEDLISMADGKSKINKNQDREGLVLRNRDRTVSFKVISNKFLLKNEDE